MHSHSSSHGFCIASEPFRAAAVATYSLTSAQVSQKHYNLVAWTEVVAKARVCWVSRKPNSERGWPSSGRFGCCLLSCEYAWPGRPCGWMRRTRRWRWTGRWSRAPRKCTPLQCPSLMRTSHRWVWVWVSCCTSISASVYSSHTPLCSSVPSWANNGTTRSPKRRRVYSTWPSWCGPCRAALQLWRPLRVL